MYFQNTFLRRQDLSTSIAKQLSFSNNEVLIGNCRTRSCNGTFTVSLFPRRLYLPEVDCSDRSLAILDDGTGLSCKFVADAILAEQEKELPADHPYLFSVGVHTQVTQHKYTSNTTHKQSKQTENNQIK